MAFCGYGGDLVLENITDYLKKCLDLSDTTVERLVQTGFFDDAEMLQFRKGEDIINEGDKVRHTNLLIEGVVRGYLFGEKNNEITNCLIYRPGMAIMPGPDFDEPAMQSMQAITKVSVLRFPLLRFDSMLEYSPEVLRCAVKIFSRHYSDGWNLRMAKYRFDSGDRYDWFVREHGELLGRISNKYIASYLGMTPSTLSRIQKKYRNGELETAEEKEDMKAFSETRQSS